MSDGDHISDYVLNAYRELHQIPELALTEFKTSRYISDQLERMGCGVKKNIAGSTAVLGTLPVKKPGPVIVLRADMDALPYVGGDGTGYAKHTCGHDANSSMVLACAGEFARQGGLPFGELRVLFQPAEETMQGAKLVIESGVISDGDVLVGIHLRPAAEAGLHQATPKLCHGSVCLLKLKVHGVSAHASRPHLGVNALEAAALAAVAVKTLQYDPSVAHSVKATNISCGANAGNVIPSCVEMVFDLRAQNNENMERILEQTKKAIIAAVGAVGATAEFLSEDRTVAAQYDETICACAKRAIEAMLGSALPPIYTVGSEDFHYYGQSLGIKPVYIGLGAGMTAGLHAENMCFDTSALSDGVRILYHTVLEILAEYRKKA